MTKNETGDATPCSAAKDAAHEPRDVLPTALLPCPFCGGEAYLHCCPAVDDFTALLTMNCDSCCLELQVGVNGHDLIEKLDHIITLWNTRAGKPDSKGRAQG